MADWRFIAARPAPDSGVMAGEITEARDRKVTWRVEDACDAAFTLDARHELAGIVEELTIDALVYRDDELVFRGRLGASGDQADTDRHDVQFNVVDYTAIFDRRVIPTPQAPWTFTNIAQGSIVRSLLNWSQGVDGGDLDVTVSSANVPDTSILRTITFDPGKWIGEAVEDLAGLEDGFDWTIDHDLVARLWHPQRGDGPRDLVAEYGATVAAVERVFDPAEYANAIMVTGKDGTAPKYATAADITTRPEGRLDLVESFPDIGSGTVLQARANQALTTRSTLTPAYTCTMTPDVWNPRALWLGDTTWLVVKSGRLDVSSPQRVTQIEATVSDDGAEEIKITFGRARPSATKRFRTMARRLNRLERLGAV